jgi:tRNA nucleotidyltransferase (CCA-adding enzyme)
VVVFTNQQGTEQHIDVATARLEYSEHPGALPTVELSSIKMDLFRRDFTINALAVQLNEAHFGTLIDPFGAQRDMKEKTINILHSLTFIEDPTRIMRAIRFETRFAFRLGAQTERLIKNALQLNMLERVSGARIFNELCHIFDEQDAVKAIMRLDHFDILRAVHPQLKLQPTRAALLQEADEIITWYDRMYIGKNPRRWLLFFLILLLGAKYPEAADVLRRLGFIRKRVTEFLRLREALRQVSGKLDAWQADPPRMSGLHALLSALPVEGILLLIALNARKPLSKTISHYLSRLYMEKPDITGADLDDLGGKPGPLYGKILNAVLAAKLDGTVKTKEEQLNLASALLAAQGEEERITFAAHEVLRGRT